LCLLRPPLRTFLRLGESLRVELTVQSRAEDKKRRRSRGQQIEGKEIGLVPEPAHQSRLYPFARQPGRGGSLEHRDELDQRLESFGSRELFRTHQPKQENEATGSEQSNHRQDVARSPGGKRIYEQQRHC